MYEMIEPIDQIFASIELSGSIFDALIGAFIGGFFTWLAAYYTMEKQRKLQMNITVRRSRQFGVARATCPHSSMPKWVLPFSPIKCPHPPFHVCIQSGQLVLHGQNHCHECFPAETVQFFR